MVLEPLQNLKAITARHLEIGDDDAREGELCAICVAAFAFQVTERVLAVRANMHWQIDPILSEGMLKKHRIVGVIFCDQDDQLSPVFVPHSGKRTPVDRKFNAVWAKVTDRASRAACP
jgi:butyrate kinase